MNTYPDETTLTLWMDGELEGEDLQRMEAWAQEHPELLAERDAIQALSQNMQQNLPASVEPPYPDFFNERIQRAIQEETAPVTAPTQSSGGFWKWLAAPLAAGAMAVCFYLGTQVAPTGTNPMQNTSVASTVYTPDNSVEANIFVANNQEATVIVLEGLEDIPDDLDMVGSPYDQNPDRVMVSSEEIY